MAAANPKKPVMDVSKPGKSPANATARPIITGHEMMKDPMVNEEPAKMEGVTEDVTSSEEKTEKAAVAPTSHKIIQPLGDAEEKPAETDEKSASEDEKSEPTEEEATEDKKEAAPPPVTDDAVVDAVLDQVGDKKEETKESEEERKRQEQVNKLVEEKKYFVPIGQINKRRNNRIVLLILGALLPVIVGLGLAADAGAINLGFKVPFDFIKDKSVSTTQPTQNNATSTEQPVQPTTKKFTAKADNFSFTYPSSWVIKDNSVNNTTGKSLSVSLNTGKTTYVVFTVSGKGGDCVPAKTDQPYSKTNKCPTYEETAYTKTTNGTLVKTKFMDPATQKTTEHICYRPKVDVNGTPITVLDADLNKPHMGFYLECASSDLWVGLVQNGTQTVFGVFDQSDAADLQTVLKTVSIDYTK